MKTILSLTFVTLTSCAFDDARLKEAATRIGEAAAIAAAEEAVAVALEELQRPSK